MRLFVDCRWFDQPGQGVVTYIVRLHEALAALPPAGERIEMLLGVTDRSKVDLRLVPANAELVEVGRRGFLWRLLRYPALLDRLKVDVAHFQYVCPLRRSRARYIVTLHDVIFLRLPGLFPTKYRAARKLFFGRSARSAAAVLTVSEESARDIARFFPGHAPVTVVHNGFALPGSGEAAAPASDLHPGGYILTVGRVEPRKNYRRLIDAYRQSGLGPAVPLVIVGFCDAEFRSEIAALESGGGVRWLRYVSDAELRWLYQHARAFIYPSLAEGFGIPVLEAMAAGLPCAVASTFPLDDVRERAAVVFDPEDTPEMASALTAIASAPPPADAAAIAARYSWEESARRYRDVLTRVAALP